MKRTGILTILCILLSILPACTTTEKDVHIHHWLPATYEEPERCECGRTRGEALIPFALDKGIVTDMQIGVKYPFYAKTVDRPDVETKGSVKITDFRIVESEGEDFFARAGYEWRITEIEFVFDGTEAYKYGVSYDFMALDYYQEMGYGEVFYVDWQGKSYSCQEKYLQNAKWQKKTLVAKWVYGICVPAGYDGGILVFCNKDFLLSLIENNQEGKFSELAGDRAHSFRMIDTK